MVDVGIAMYARRGFLSEIWLEQALIKSKGMKCDF